jgi:hypothetical protein
VHGGVASANLSYTFDSFLGPEKFDHNPQGWFGGGQIGLQRQSGRVVVGIEASYSALNLICSRRGSATNSDPLSPDL